jgi:hypothetical protein
MGEEQGVTQVTRIGWPLVGGLLMGLWLLMPMLLATAGTKSDPKPAISAAELSTIRGVVKATAQATLASQVQGRISQLPFKEGQRFKKGALLVALDCSKYEAELASVQAEHREKEDENNLQPPNTMPLGPSSRLSADAEKAVRRKAQVTVNGCTVRTVSRTCVKMIVNEHENVFPNDQLISLPMIACWRSNYSPSSPRVAKGRHAEYISRNGTWQPAVVRTSARMSILPARR